MEELKSFFEGVAVPVAMSMLGGIAKAASRGCGSWRQFVASLFVSGFAGMVVHLFIQDAAIPPSARAGLVGLSGYSGVVILDGLAACSQRMLEKIIGQRMGREAWDGVERRRRRGAGGRGEGGR